MYKNSHCVLSSCISSPWLWQQVSVASSPNYLFAIPKLHCLHSPTTQHVPAGDASEQRLIWPGLARPSVSLGWRQVVHQSWLGGLQVCVHPNKPLHQWQDNGKHTRQRKWWAFCGNQHSWCSLQLLSDRVFSEFQYRMGRGIFRSVVEY